MANTAPHLLGRPPWAYLLGTAAAAAVVGGLSFRLQVVAFKLQLDDSHFDLLVDHAQCVSRG